MDRKSCTLCILYLKTLACWHPTNKVKKHQRTKKHPHGGAWRAWVRRRTVGQVGRPPLAQLAQEFHAAKAAGALEGAAEAGQMHTKWALVVKQTGRKVPGQLQTSRALKALQKRRQQEVFFLQNCSMTWQGKLQAIQEQVCSAQGSEQAGQLARAFQSWELAQRRKAEQEHDQIEKQYEELYGKPRKEQLQRAWPCLANLELQCVAHPGLNVVQLQQGKMVDECLQACAWLCAHPQSNVGASLEKCWGSMHETVHEGPAMPEPDTQQASSGHGACLQAGICLCSGNLKRVRNRLLKLFKETLTLKHVKHLLAAGHIVMKISLASDITMEPSASITRQYFYHVGLMSWSPYKPTLHELALAAAPNGEEAVEDMIYLKAHVHWELGFYQALMTSAPILQKEPNILAVKKLNSVCMQLWPVPRRGPGRRVAQPDDNGPDSWGAVAAIRSSVVEDVEVEKDESVEDLPLPPEEETATKAELDELLSRAMEELEAGADKEEDEGTIDTALQVLGLPAEEDMEVGEPLAVSIIEADQEMQPIDCTAAASMQCDDTGVAVGAEDPPHAVARALPVSVRAGTRQSAEIFCVIPNLGKI
eukprot:3949828-Amphidinium_carterae.1